jgi:RNA polymerase sigma factor (sigma-70 family)
LSDADRAELRRLIEAGDRARTAFIDANLRLVVSVPRSYAHVGVPLADLVQEGTLALMTAVERWYWRRGWRLATYAIWWVRQAVIRAVNLRSTAERANDSVSGVGGVGGWVDAGEAGARRRVERPNTSGRTTKKIWRAMSTSTRGTGNPVRGPAPVGDRSRASTSALATASRGTPSRFSNASTPEAVSTPYWAPPPGHSMLTGAPSTSTL